MNFDLCVDLIQFTNNENKVRDGNYTPFKSINLGELKLDELKVGSFDNPINYIEIEDKNPGRLLGISDPTSNLVLSDEKVFLPTKHDMINTKVSDVISFK